MKELIIIELCRLAIDLTPDRDDVYTEFTRIKMSELINQYNKLVQKEKEQIMWFITMNYTLQDWLVFYGLGLIVLVLYIIINNIETKKSNKENETL